MSMATLNGEGTVPYEQHRLLLIEYNGMLRELSLLKERQIKLERRVFEQTIVIKKLREEKRGP